jgi:hypothetical protein
VASTGTATTQPGKAIASVMVNAATTMPAMPATLSSTPARRGSLASWVASSARSAPAPSSQARVNGEKYAWVAFCSV